MTTASAPGGIMEPVETSAASPEEMEISGVRPMATLPARRKLTARSSLASMVSSARTAKPSMEAREKPGTSIEETIFSARMQPAARLRGTLAVLAAGRCCRTMDLASSRAMRLWNSLGMVWGLAGGYKSHETDERLFHRRPE